MTDPDPVVGGHAVVGGRAEPGAAELDFLRRLAVDDPLLYTLAQALCLAPHATTAFVRRARLEFVPASAAGLEADLWFSPLVESADARAVVLDPLYAAGLRHELVRNPVRRRAVHALTEEMQRHAPELVRRYTRLALADAGGPDAAAVVDAELAGFAAALAVDAGDDDAAEDLSRWLVHFLPRLPGVLATDALARTLLISAATRLAVDPPQWVLDRHGPAGVAAARAAVRGHTELGVWLDDNGLTLSRPPAPGARVLEVPGGDRVWVELAGAGAAGAGGYAVEVGAAETVRVAVAVFAELVDEAYSTRPQPGSVAQLRSVEVVFGGSAALADGGLRAVLRRIGNDTDLLIFGNVTPVTVGLIGTPELLRVDHATGTVLLSSHGDLVVVGYSGAEVSRVSGLGRIHDAVVVPPRRTGRRPEVILANERGIWAVRPDAPSEPPRILSRSTGPNPRLWAPAQSSQVVVAFADGHLEFVHVDGGSPMHDSGTEQRPITALSGGVAGYPLVFARPGPELVVSLTSASSYAIRGPELSREIRSLAAHPDGRSGLAVDVSGRLLKWSSEPAPDRLQERRLPFSAVHVSAPSPFAFGIIGRGGPVELRAEDGRTFLLTPRRTVDAKRDWLRDTLVGTMPMDLTQDDLETARRFGIGCVCLPFAPDGVVGSTAPALFRAARAAGIRVLADVVVGPDEVDTPRLLRYCAELLAAGAAGARVLVPERGPAGSAAGSIPVPSAGFLGGLRTLVDDHPGQVLVLDHGAWSGSDRGIAEGVCDLVLAGETRPWRWAGRSGGAVEPNQARNWRVSLAGSVDGDPASAMAIASATLALPGLRAVAEVPSGLPPDRLAALLRARRGERALTRGSAIRLPSIHADVVALLRRYKEEYVLCVANLGPDGRVIALTTPSVPAGRLVDLLDVAAPHQERTRSGGPTLLTLAPYEYRWFRVLTTDELYASRP
ncbi:hypothetical protein [Embleya sp. NPDC059259]|uniref:hypothetical protein n=1 Tax=unclassified Embleya TaxID=2699296 RepID=UPI0036B66827